ncbi:MAG TPA: sigma factor [Gemmatimonadales bacterium]|nr:sigma factor [Gemmatimonadales bacterium]
MTYLRMSDAQLIERMAAGDRQAHQQLEERHRLSLYARVYAVLADPEETDRVVAEALERAWNAARHFNPGAGSAAAWLGEIAREIAARRQPPAIS